MRNKGQDIISEGVEEFYEEKYRRTMERQAEKNAMEELDRHEKIKHENKMQFARNYLEKNPQEVCGKCLKKEYRCNLIAEVECGLAGLTINQKDLDGKEFEMKKIGKYLLDGEIYVPLTDERIKQTTIFA